MYEPVSVIPAAPSAPKDVTVYIIQDNPQINMLPASAYGRLVFMLPPGQRSMFNGQPIARQLRALMKGCKPTDLLLPVGDPAAIACASAIMVDETGGWLNLLKYDRQERCYYPVLIDVFDRFPKKRIA